MLLDIYHKSSSDMEQNSYVKLYSTSAKQTNTTRTRVFPKHRVKPFNTINRNTHKNYIHLSLCMVHI